MRKYKLFNTIDTLSLSLNQSNTNYNDVAPDKENDETLHAALIKAAKKGQPFCKNINIDSNVEKNKKSSLNKKYKQSNKISGSNDNMLLSKRDITNVIIPSKSYKNNKLSKNTTNSNIDFEQSKQSTLNKKPTQSNKISDSNDNMLLSNSITDIIIPSKSYKNNKNTSNSNNILEEVKSSSLSTNITPAVAKFKTPMAAVSRGNEKLQKSSWVALMSSPILTSSPIVPQKRKNDSHYRELLSTSINASSDTAANSNRTESLLGNTFISPILKKNQSNENYKLSQKHSFPRKPCKRKTRRHSAPIVITQCTVTTRYGRVVQSFADSKKGRFIAQHYSTLYK